MWGLCWAILVLILGQRGTPPQFFSDLCCFFGGAKNTVNYEVFRGADHSRRQGAAAVWLKLWPSAGGVAGRQALLARFKELTPNSGPAGQKVQGGISSSSISIIISSICLNNSSSSPPSSSSSSSSSPWSSSPASSSASASTTTTATTTRRRRGTTTQQQQ